MRELILVPTYCRTEFLAVCLEAIRKANPEADIHCFPDRGTIELDVCQQFNATHHLTIQHSYHGNSFNVVSALNWASHQSCGIVYVIEDDAIVDESFFKWCRAALESHPEAFAACGWQYSPDAIISDGPDLLMPWYLSVAAALPRKSLTGIVQHARPEYYSDMKRYLDSRFPASPRRGSNHYEQDGLVLRVMESEQKRCVWPRRPRALHIGFHGYHMPNGQELEGSLDDRVRIVKMAIDNPPVLARLMAGGSLPKLGRCAVCQKLLLVDCDYRAECVECFHEKYPNLDKTSNSHYYLKPYLSKYGLEDDKL